MTNKQRITIRIDQDVIDWAKSLSTGGKGYQTKINNALRQAMADEHLTKNLVLELKRFSRTVQELKEEVKALKQRIHQQDNPSLDTINSNNYTML